MVRYEKIPDYMDQRFSQWKIEKDRIFSPAAKRAEEYYYSDVEETGTNYTKKQKGNIDNTHNIPVNINFIHPTTQQKLAIIMDSRPSTKIVSVYGDRKEEAYFLDKLKHGVFRESNMLMELEEFIKYTLISGMGHAQVVPSNFFKPSELGVTIKNIPYDYIVLDPNCTDRSTSDMEGYFVFKEITQSRAKIFYNRILSIIKQRLNKEVSIEQLSGTIPLYGDTTDKQVPISNEMGTESTLFVREFYEKVPSIMYLIEDQNNNIQRVFEENLYPEQKGILSNAVDKVEGIYEKKHIILGDTIVDSKIQPITNWSLQTAFYEWGGRPYRSKGMVHFVKPSQEAYDKIIQTFLLNGILSNNAGIEAPVGSIPKEQEANWKKHGNDPTKIKFYNPVQIGDQVFKPEREQISPLSNFYPTMLETIRAAMNNSTGITPMVSGDASESKIETFSSLQQYQSAAMKRIILTTRHINRTLENLTNVLIEHLINNLTPEKVYMMYDEEDKLMEINITKEIASSIKLGKYKVTSVPSTALPTQRLAIAGELAKIAQSTADPNERAIYTHKAMELSDIKEVKGLLEKLDRVNKLSQQVNSLEEANDRLVEQSKQMENRLVNTEVENRILEKYYSKAESLTDNFARAQQEIKDTKKTIVNKDNNNR